RAIIGKLHIRPVVSMKQTSGHQPILWSSDADRHAILRRMKAEGLEGPCGDFNVTTEDQVFHQKNPFPGSAIKSQLLSWSVTPLAEPFATVATLVRIEQHCPMPSTVVQFATIDEFAGHSA